MAAPITSGALAVSRVGVFVRTSVIGDRWFRVGARCAEKVRIPLAPGDGDVEGQRGVVDEPANLLHLDEVVGPPSLIVELHARAI